MKSLAFLFWALVFFLLWTPFALIFRLLGGRVASLGARPRALSVWQLRSSRRFRPMTRPF